jgi:ABC-type transport system involved in multi-copper enzyme maturation permease subunit
MHGALAIARFALLEARRSPLPWLAGAALAAALALAAFVSQVAIAEGTKVQASVTAALLRAAAVFLVATHVVASIAREANDRVLDFVLASALSRPAWYLGKLAGFAVAGAILAVAFAAPLLLWAAPGAVAAWALSLALECMLVGAAALFFATALAQPAAALGATAGLYLLGRSIGAIQAIASGPIAPQGVGGRAAEWAVEALALLLPRLDAVSRSAWLLYDPPSAAEFGAAGAVLVAYTALLAAAGLFDLARRSL